MYLGWLILPQRVESRAAPRSATFRWKVIFFSLSLSLFGRRGNSIYLAKFS